MVEGELKEEKKKKRAKNNLFRTKINGLSDCFFKTQNDASEIAVANGSEILV